MASPLPGEDKKQTRGKKLHAALLIKALILIILATISPDFWRMTSMAHASDSNRDHEGTKTNRLIHEKSPYLLQHAYNPVDWYPWGDEAFEKARQENKPIFLSIGYSTCHWCHVMERESFEDPEVAGLMNDAFVSIKVDREERPDLDHIYMAVCQMLTGSGGWPLTIIMTPEKKPFFAATYIPKSGRFGQAGMMELIPRIKEVWRSRYGEIMESSEKIFQALQGLDEKPGGDLDGTTLTRAYQELGSRFDGEYGGFGSAPKFPTPHNFLFMLRYWKRRGDKSALEMVEKTLQAMRRGGIFDQIGFGFHRYSTDRRWLVPHFEKMLYDQAMLAMAYLDAYQATRRSVYKKTAEEIFAYVLRDMQSPGGGFYSAEDADSEGVEGKFYVWEKSEIQRVLDREEADFISRVFNVSEKGNFKEEATDRSTGSNIFHLDKSIQKIASELKISVPEFEKRLESARIKLFKTREGRVHPYKDDKILTDWNGLMIAALSRGAQVLGEPAYARAAGDAIRFIFEQLQTTEGRLLHRYRDGEAKITAHLDDYAFLAWGLIELYEATFESQYLRRALEINEDMLKYFWDEEAGGFFFTPDDGERLIVRKKEIYDGAIPSGNAVAMLNLIRLARFTGRTDLDEKASRIDNAFSSQIGQSPSAYTQFLVALNFALGPSNEIVIVGPTGAKDTEAMLKALRETYIPNRVILFRPIDKKSPEIDTLSGFIKNFNPINGKATAYVCHDFACELPTTDIDEMLKKIKS